MRNGLSGLKGAVTLVTGASGGIGAALARVLASQGAVLILLARREERLIALRNELAQSVQQLEATFYPLDIANHAAVDRMIEDVVRRYRRIDILINNAAYGIDGLFIDTPMQAERDIFETNVFAPLYLMKKVLPIMESQGGGKIMNIGSVVGHRAMPVMSAYCATKSALKAYTESLRVEYAKKGIQVMYASPGHTQSDFLAHQKRFGLFHRKGVGVSPMPAGACARLLVKALANNHRDVVLTAIGKIGIFLNRFAPSLIDRVLLSRV